MRRGWRPILVGAAIAIGTFALAKAQIFAPSAPAGTAVAGDATRGQSIFDSTCSGCHGAGGKGGGVGPALAGTGLDATTVTTTVQQGRSVMPAGLVSGQDLADVVAYVVSISSPSG
ncbi:MAG TPA: c-type cytochrome [Gaiellaceae bacterium]|nr:c-type cytochrome [Gaiellaceae bacterium]